jgi:hypothetical protein
MMAKKKNKEKPARNSEETQTGYGNKKIEGPNRPST